MEKKADTRPSTSRSRSGIATYANSPLVRALGMVFLVFLALMLQNCLVSGIVAHFEAPVLSYLLSADAIMAFTSM